MTGTNAGIGGGILVNAVGGTLIANNSTISNNTASSTTTGGATGGGIYSNGTVTLTGSTVSGNTASPTGAGSGGGGIYNTGATMTLTNTTVSGNVATASSTFNAIGAGIEHLAGTMNITDSSVSNNNATTTGTGSGIAGGIYNQQATLILTRSTVSGNTAPIHAGIRTLASIAATTTINQSAVVNNISTVEGGGVINASVGAAAATTNINNSTIGGNRSAGSAAGIENFNTAAGAAVVNINYSTVAGNGANTDNSGADSGGGIANFGGGTGPSTVNLTSSIVADNTVGTGGTGPDISGIITSGTYNHVENTAGGTFTPTVGDVTGSDPALTALALNGGTTLNYKPGPTSPVLDTIPNGVNGCGTAPFNVDQRNMVRPTDSNNDMTAACEKGADEVMAITAAGVSVSGQVLNGTSGKATGIANAVVTLVDGNGNTRVARTNSFGYYVFDDLEVGQTYVFYVSARRYQFSTQVVSLTNAVTNQNFTPIE